MTVDLYNYANVIGYIFWQNQSKFVWFMFLYIMILIVFEQSEPAKRLDKNTDIYRLP